MMYQVKFRNGDTFTTGQPDYWQRGYEPWEIYHDKRCPDVAQARELLARLYQFRMVADGQSKGFNEDRINAEYPLVLKKWNPKRREGIKRERDLTSHVIKLANSHTVIIPPYLIPKITEMET